MKNIDYTAAISSGTIDFEQACALQTYDNITDAIRDCVLTFDEAAAIMAVEQVKSTPKKSQNKGKKSPKRAKSPKKPKEQYTKSGMIVQNEEHNTLTSGQLRRVHNAIKKLEEQGFTCGWKRKGGWIHIYSKDGKGYTPEFKSATLARGWSYWTTPSGRDCGVFIDKTMLKNATDSKRK